jgi:peptide deformylase
VEGFTPGGDEVELEVSGMLSRAIQHEIDHLDGILFIDRVSPLKRKLLLKKWKKSREQEMAS